MISGGGLALALLALAACVVFRIQISLSFLESAIEVSAGKILGREITIDGPVRLVVSRRPRLGIADIKIGNPKDWSGPEGEREFVKIDRFGANVDLLELLRHRIDIDRLDVEGVTIALAESADGAANWKLEGIASGPPGGNAADSAPGDGYRFAGVEQIAIHNLDVSVADTRGDRTSVMLLDALTGRAGADKPLSFAASGSIFGRAIRANLTGESPEGLSAPPVVFQFRFDLPGTSEPEPGASPLNDPVPLSLSGHIEFTSERFRLPDLSGTLGEASIAGHLTADFSAAQPRADGALSIETLELGRYLTGDHRREVRPGEFDFEEVFTRCVNPSGAPEEKTILGFLGRLEVTVGHLIGIRSEAHEVSLVLDADEDSASMGGSAYFMDSRFDAIAELNRSAARDLGFTAKVGCEDVDIGALLGFGLGETGVTGRSDSISLHYHGSGAGLREIREHAEIGFAAGPSTLDLARRGGPMKLRVDGGSLTRKATGRGELAISGALEEVPFTARGTFVARPGEAGINVVSCDVEATGSGATIAIERADGDAEYVFSLEGERVGDLARWTRISPLEEIAYSARGRFLEAGDGDGWQIQGLEGQIGTGSFSGGIGHLKSSPGDAVKVLKIDLALPTIDVKALTTALDAPGEEAETATGLNPAPAASPAGIGKINADVTLAIEGLQFSENVLRDVKVQANLREGRAAAAPFEASFGGTRFHGKAALDLREGSRGADFDLAAEDVALGRILGELEAIEEGVEATAGTMRLVVQARGATGRELLLKSSFEATMRDGVWELRGRSTDAKVEFNVEEATISAPAGEPLHFELKGAISDAPVILRVQTDGVTAFAEESQDMHLRFEASLGGTRLVLDDRVALPLDRSDLGGDIVIESTSLSDLNELIDVRLPPWGPSRLSTRLAIGKEGYTLEKLKGTIGETDLAGILQIRTAGSRPRFTGALHIGHFQVSDFHKEGWSPYGPSGNAGGPRDVPFRPGQRIEALFAHTNAVLSPGVLQSFDGKISIEADDVFSHRERLGSGKLVALLEKGKLRVAPASLDIPGGNVRLELGYAHLGKEVQADFSIKMEDFDYGIIARHKDSASRAAGRVDVDVAINARPPAGRSFLAYGNGRINFSICPDNVGAEAFDLWATNLLLAIIPKLDPEKKSKVNCLLAELTLADGVLKTDKFLIDVTRVRAEASGVVDFKKEDINLTLIPTAKTPQMLNLASAITVDGTFDNFRKRLTMGDAVRTVSGSAARTVLFPLRFLTKNRMPADGSDICPCGQKR